MQPEQIGRYRIEGELGHGGFATVFLGEDRGLDDLVAIKLLADTHSSDTDSVERFVAEARVMRNLRTPGVVTVHDVGEHEGRPYFVMEYCERGTLSDRLKSLGRALTVDEGYGLARAISRAMSGLHGANPPVVHRDIKPGNLLIRHTPNTPQRAVGELLADDEELIVGDFGLAKVVDPDSTKLSLIAYTRGFAPPEQIRGDGSILPSADVYSASAVVLAAVSQERPAQMFVDGDDPFSEEALESAGSLRPALERGLNFDRHARHRTISEWFEAMADPNADVVPGSEFEAAGETDEAAPATQFVEAEQQSVPAQAHGATPDRAAESHDAADTNRGIARPALIATAIGLVAIVGILAVALLTRSGPEIVGPSQGRVGEELAFTVLNAEVEAWDVGGVRTVDEVLRFTPMSAGAVEIEATTSDGTSRVRVEVQEDDSPLRIVGPSVLPIGEVTVLSGEGAADGELIWLVGGETYRQATVELQPSTAGTMSIEVATADGDRVARTFTVPPDGTQPSE